MGFYSSLGKKEKFDHGYTERESLIKVEKSWWQEKVSDPLGSFLTEVFHPGKKDLNFAKGNLAIISFRLKGKKLSGSQIFLHLLMILEIKILRF